MMNSELRIPNSEGPFRRKLLLATANPPRPQRAFRFRPSGFTRHWTFAIRTCALLALFFLAHSAHACAVCFGNNDSQLSRGMLAGVLVLLFVVLAVLGGFVALFVHRARRSAAMAALEKQSPETESLK
jgi:hypothetical protein